MEPIGIAIAGCGSIAESKYLSNLYKMDGVECVGFLGGRAQEYCRKYGAAGARVYGTPDELCADARVRAVCVCAPNFAHAELSVAALRAGKHVLCEKPMAVDLAGAEAMARAAQESGCLLSVGHQARFGAAAQALHTDCRSGRLGRVYFARASMIRRRGVPTWGHFLERGRQGGGCLIDLGTHALDLALWLMDDWEPAYAVCSVSHALADKPTAANRWGAWEPAKFEVEDAAFGFVRMKSGATLSLDCSWALNVPADREGDVLLCGDEAGAVLSEDRYALNGARDGAFYEEPYVFEDGEDDANRRQLADFVAAVREGREPLVTAAQSLAVCRILSALYESSETGRPVEFAE